MREKGLVTSSFILVVIVSKDLDITDDVWLIKGFKSSEGIIHSGLMSTSLQSFRYWSLSLPSLLNIPLSFW